MANQRLIVEGKTIDGPTTISPERISEELRTGTQRYDRIGILLLVVGVLGAAGTAWFLHDNFAEFASSALAASDHVVEQVVYLVRTSVVGGVLATAVYGLFRLARASFDQSVRFMKRRHAALFLSAVFDSLGVGGPEDLQKIMKSFEAWNHNVPSAFTDPKMVTAIASGATEQDIGRVLDILSKAMEFAKTTSHASA